MKFVIFPAVDYQLLIRFIQELDFSKLHIELFEKLKLLIPFLKKIFQRIDGQIYPPSYLFTTAKSDDYFGFIFTRNISPIQKLPEIIFYQNEFEIQINHLKNIFNLKEKKKSI
jgi:hypothetical protein